MDVDKIYDAVLDYDDEEVAALVGAELEAGTDFQGILQDSLVDRGQEIQRGHPVCARDADGRRRSQGRPRPAAPRPGRNL